ncbi:glycosyltransferase family 2 protein [Geomonas subterranea]|uniref:Glycosyltransferase n=1 Tax=Geomonas subterranea TaxID=2847989 RepID=A0ABX8LNN7_9BACT|nr:MULTISPECIES: glycosyltransferase [Geomonas]QXE92249.1 glycosyltransferase [Geomonas subterranea]QXM09651.1 glycosyltransferase [Geomonas subterranea]
MTDAVIDVIIPVWNRPDETRNCLVNLINHTPEARLIIVDCGSERDTERILQEFADGLEDRALLMRDDSNIGFVRAVNRGFESSSAPFLALLRNTSIVAARWLDPLLQFAEAHPEAGILLPCLDPGDPCEGPCEVERGSFAAMVIRRELYREIGGLDENLDGGAWCLKDFTRRACAKGYLTCQVPGPAVSHQEEAPLGSEQRRRETLQRSMTAFRERWGEGGSYLLHVPKGVELELLRQKLEWLVQGARHGDRYTVLLPSALGQAARQSGLCCLHENVKLVSLPRLSWDGKRRRFYEKLVAQRPGTMPVTAVDGMPFPWSERYLSFTELAERIKVRLH